MKFWVEVTGDYQWDLRKKEKVGIHGPPITRYYNMLNSIQKEDVILHYCTSMRASDRSLKSSILGISKAKSNLTEDRGRYNIEIEKPLELKHPIKFKEFSKIKNPSKKFKFMIHANLQKYIFEIEKTDFLKILSLKKENYIRISENKEYRDIFTD